MKRSVALSSLPLLLLGFTSAAGAVNPAGTAGDYPTTAVVDYVLGCMRANGQTRQSLESCSCSIDVIASILPYDRYERAETFKSMSLTTGENAGLFRESKPARQSRTELKRAQAEADVRCF
ncbi:hypothetical protein [Mesorhizobium koreense]|uniref:hypothetical protein n=1 Tax=Mesorhizobium koreense TaxID=3074855 RepID=UPI00287BB7A3|nr:hypothetical protein [Mesorhizobium sp. WR6]